MTDWDLRTGFVVGLCSALFLFVVLKVFDPRTLWSGKDRERSPDSGLGWPAFVAIGGGTGLSTLLMGLKMFTRDITAVVAVTDEGGSSGRLRKEWGVLPPGDVRNCIVALAENDNSLKRILDFRFDRGELKGHSLGNLILLAVTELRGDFRAAVEEMNHLLAIRGRVMPVTNESVTLSARTRDGRLLRGEIQITENGSKIEDIWLEPEGAKAVPDVLEAVDRATLIVLGPGSLFTSVVPNLLMSDFTEKIRASGKPTVYVCNLMTQPGETDGMDVVAHLDWITRIMGYPPDYILVNKAPIPRQALENYETERSMPLLLTPRQAVAIRRRGCEVVEGDFVHVLSDRLVRHDFQKVAEVLVHLCCEIAEE
jgi:uncharacterized cofD-like protein